MPAKQKYTEDFLSSKKFWYLTFISRIREKTKYGYISHCKWRCDCGNEIVYSPYSVVNEKNKSCGCRKCETRRHSVHWKGYEDIPGRFWSDIKRGATIRNLEVTITIKDIWNLFVQQNRRCALSYEFLKFDTDWKIKDGTASLDRIDSNNGYIKGNIQWVHKKINIMKNCYPQDEFIEWCKKVVEQNNCLTKSKVVV